MFFTLDFLNNNAPMQIPMANVKSNDMVSIRLCDISISIRGFSSTVGRSVIFMPASIVL